MNHNQFKEWLLLSVYGELTSEEQQVLDDHLPECAECRSELAELNKLNAAIGKRKLVEPSDQLLREARRELQVALRIERSRRTLLQRVKDYVTETLSPQYRIAFGAAAMLGIGLLAGYWIFSAPHSSSQPGALVVEEDATQYSEVGEARIANVRFIDADPSDGQVEFVFEAVKPMRIKGDINDKQIQKVLTHALLNNQNPGVRLRIVSTIARHRRAQLQSQVSGQVQDEELIDALIEALRDDPNDGVRKEALKVLRSFPMTKAIRDAILYVLMHDKNPGLRVDAIKSMEQAKMEERFVDDQLLNVLKQKVEQDDNNYIRLRAKALLQEVKQP